MASKTWTFFPLLLIVSRNCCSVSGSEQCAYGPKLKARKTSTYITCSILKGFTNVDWQICREKVSFVGPLDCRWEVWKPLCRWLPYPSCYPMNAVREKRSYSKIEITGEARMRRFHHDEETLRFLGVFSRGIVAVKIFTVRVARSSEMWPSRCEPKPNISLLLEVLFADILTLFPPPYNLWD